MAPKPQCAESSRILNDWSIDEKRTNRKIIIVETRTLIQTDAFYRLTSRACLKSFWRRSLRTTSTRRCLCTLWPSSIHLRIMIAALCFGNFSLESLHSRLPPPFLRRLTGTPPLAAPPTSSVGCPDGTTASDDKLDMETDEFENCRAAFAAEWLNPRNDNIFQRESIPSVPRITNPQL